MRSYELSLDAGGKDSALKLGDYFFYGLGGLPTNPLAAAAMYSRASAAGSSQAAFNLGLMVCGAGSVHPGSGCLVGVCCLGMDADGVAACAG